MSIRAEVEEPTDHNACFHDLSLIAVSHQNNACDSKNLVFTGSYATES